MKYGFSRGSHRIITDKCKELGFLKTVELLTGKTTEEINADLDKELKPRRVKTMYETAELYGYIITKKE